MPGIVDFAIKQWRMTLALLVFAVIGGFLAMFSIPLDAEPDVAIPFVTVQVVLPGVSPEDAERLLIKPLETELKSLDGLKQMDSVARTNVGIVILEFEPNFDQDEVIDDVIESVNKARGELPTEAKEPIVEELNTQTLPIIVVNIYGDAPDRTLQALAKQLQTKLEANPSILEATIQGEREQLLEAVINPTLMESYQITYNELAAAISRNNSLVAAGKLETDSGKFAIKLPGLIENAHDMEEIVVRTGPDGSIIQLKDIAMIRETFKDRSSYALFQNRPSVSIEVSKRLGENIIETIEEVRKITDEETENWPETVKVELSQDQTIFIREMISSLVSSIINAIVLVIIVCIIALGLRSALMVGFAIPASFLITVFIFMVQGASINMMVMFGMVLSVGILVDSAIVIIEYADRKLSEGLSRKEAYSLAGKRMFWPIVSSTATTMAAFIPLLFWNTLPGQFMSYFPKTLVFVLTASMLMALIFLPTLGTLIGPKTIRNPKESVKNLSAADGDPMSLKGFTGTYARTINTLAKRPLVVLILILAMVASIFVWFKSTPHKVEFFTADGGDQVYIYARSRGNTSTLNEYDIAKTVEQRLGKLDGVKSVFTIAGQNAATGGGFRGPSSIPTDTVARTYLELLPFDQRRNSKEIVDDANAAIKDIPGVIMELTVLSDGPPVGKDVTVQLVSENLEKLNIAADKLSQYMQNYEGLTAFENTTPLPGIEWQLEIDRAEAGRLGVDVSTIGAAVQFVTEGSLVGFYRPLSAKDEIDIRIRFPKSSRDLSALDSLRIQTPNGGLPLSTVVKRKAKPRQDSIARRDQARVYEVKSNTATGFATNQIVTELQDWIEQQPEFKGDVSHKFLGQDEENKAAAEFFTLAGIAMLFMMGVILLWQFNSFWHVFLTLSAVIFSAAGVLLGLQFYPYISIILCGTGVLALAGIVVNNNIVLIDTFQRLRSEGFNAHDAAVRTAAQRMRPVVLTTITTIIGLMPMVLAIQADLFTGEFSTRGTSTSTIWAPISYVLVCGLGFSTLLTLVLTPVMLAAPSLWLASLKRLYQQIISKEEASHPNQEGAASSE